MRPRSLLIAAILSLLYISAASATLWTPPLIAVEGTFAGSYSIPGKGVYSRFTQYYDYNNRRFLQTVSSWLSNHPISYLWVNNQVYVTLNSKCSVFPDQPYPIPPDMLAQVNSTYFGTEIITLQNGSQVPADHWGGYNFLCRNISLHFAMYWQPVASPLPVRHAHIGVFSDGASELYDFDAWSLSVPDPAVFNVPSNCHNDADIHFAPHALPTARLGEYAAAAAQLR